jgi:hypothetical protein
MVDDLHKSASFDGNATPRRSTSSLEPYEPHRSSGPTETTDRGRQHLHCHRILRLDLRRRVGAGPPAVFAKLRALRGARRVRGFSPDVPLDCGGGRRYCASSLESQPFRASNFAGAVAHRSQFCNVLMYATAPVVRASRHTFYRFPNSLWWNDVSCDMAKLADAPVRF